MKPRVNIATGEPVYLDMPPFHPDNRFAALMKPVAT
jgi:hypothetical protein